MMNSPDKMTSKDIIRNKLADGSYKLVEKVVNDKTSSCWLNFKLVVDSATNKQVGFVQCTKGTCKSILAYGGSTTGMIKHKCCVKSEPRQCDGVSREDQMKLKNKCVIMCTGDLLPPSILAGEGFVEFSQELINIGDKYGRVSVAEVLPDPRTISSHIADMADQIRRSIIPHIKEALSSKQCAMTCDLWTDNYKKVHYLTVSSSYIPNDRWELKNSILFTSKLPDVSTPGRDILSEIQEQMTELHISPEELKKVAFVTDQRSNVRKAFENHERFPCIVNCINTSLHHTLDETFLLYEIPSVFYLIQCARRVVGYMKRSGLVSRLSTTNHEDIESRYDSVHSYMLLNCLHTQYQEVLDILHEEGKQDMLNAFDNNLMVDLIEFLRPYKEATDDLEGDKQPTLPLAVPWICSLLRNCKVLDTDREALKKIKNRAERFLQEIYSELNDIHYISTFLHPSFKELLVLDPTKRSNIHEFVREMCENVQATAPRETPSPSPAKKFKDWRSCGELKGDEVEKYLGMDVPEDCSAVLMWWQTHCSALPKMSSLAKQVLCIPASRSAGLLVADGRCSIDCDNVSNLLVVHNNVTC